MAASLVALVLVRRWCFQVGSGLARQWIRTSPVYVGSGFFPHFLRDGVLGSWGWFSSLSPWRCMLSGEVCSVVASVLRVLLALLAVLAHGTYTSLLRAHGLFVYAGWRSLHRRCFSCSASAFAPANLDIISTNPSYLAVTSSLSSSA